MPPMHAAALLTVAEHARADAGAEAGGTPVARLMEAAGAAVADVVSARFEARPCLVLCGPGDNGGDGYVAARRLAEAGWPVRVAALSRPASEAAQAARAAWTGETCALSPEAFEGAALIIDALFGAGLSCPLDGAAGDAALWTERAGAPPVVAVDLPSGARGDDGRVEGPAIQATLTVTFLRKKPGHLLEPAAGRCGSVILADIGHPATALTALAPTAFENGPALWAGRFPWPARAAHKHARGRLVVVTGEAEATGAARLAARAGLRAGAGLVTLACPPRALPIVAAASTAVMTAPFADVAELSDLARSAHAIVLGPAAGVTERTRAAVEALAASGAALVLDADALTVFAPDPEALFETLAPNAARHVLTPHAGEFARLFPDIDPDVLGKLAAARAAAARAGCVVLLKGPDTVVAAPDGRAAINAHATPFLATAGSGDVLAGIIAGLAAQGMPMWEAACAGAWLHGGCGRALGPGLIAEDLPEALPNLLRELYENAHGAP